jgi:hypothetical protein
LNAELSAGAESSIVAAASHVSFFSAGGLKGCACGTFSAGAPEKRIEDNCSCKRAVSSLNASVESADGAGFFGAGACAWILGGFAEAGFASDACGKFKTDEGGAP